MSEHVLAIMVMAKSDAAGLLQIPKRSVAKTDPTVAKTRFVKLIIR
jgi:hypothetical protein